MARSKQSKGPEVATIGPSYDYQCEQDVRTLTSAAEVLADRGRMSMAMKKFKKLNKGVDRLVDVLSTRKSSNGY